MKKKEGNSTKKKKNPHNQEQQQANMYFTHGACSSVALAGFALPECPGSSSRVYPTLEGLTAVVNSCDLFRPRPGFDPLCVRLSPPRCLTCSWACRMFRGPWGIVVVRVSWPGHPT